MSDVRKFVYLLNAMERAAMSSNPALEEYGLKRQAVLEYVEALEKVREQLYVESEGKAYAKLREYVTITRMMTPTWWYSDKECTVQHPAVTPLMKAFADEIKMQFPGIEELPESGISPNEEKS